MFIRSTFFWQLIFFNKKCWLNVIKKAHWVKIGFPYPYFFSDLQTEYKFVEDFTDNQLNKI